MAEVFRRHWRSVTMKMVLCSLLCGNCRVPFSENKTHSVTRLTKLTNTLKYNLLSSPSQLQWERWAAPGSVTAGEWQATSACYPSATEQQTIAFVMGQCVRLSCFWHVLNPAALPSLQEEDLGWCESITLGGRTIRSPCDHQNWKTTTVCDTELSRWKIKRSDVESFNLCGDLSLLLVEVSNWCYASLVKGWVTD